MFSGIKGDLLFSLTDDEVDALFGLSVTGIDDFDGDGVIDMLIGAPQSKLEGSSRGSAFVFSGSSFKLLFRFNGEKARDLFGTSVKGIGDITGDGFSEWIVGAPGTSFERFPMVGGGSAYVFSSKPVKKPDINVSPTSVDFGNVQDGMMESKVVTISNIGSAELNVDNIEFSNGSSDSFDTEPPAIPFIVPADNSVDFNVTYQAVGFGIDSGELLITSNDFDESLVSVPVSGKSLAPEIDVIPLTVNFGTVQVRRSTATILKIFNVGTDNLIVSEISLDSENNQNFTMDIPQAPPITIGPGENSDVTIKYCPFESGIFEEATILISSNDTDESLVTVNISGMRE